MNIGRLALKALTWIGRIIGLIETPAGRNFLNVILGKVLGDKAPHYLKKLAQLEQTIGAHTSAWPKIENGAKTNQSVLLDSTEAMYLYEFKRLWDKHIKAPMDKAAIKMGAIDPSEDLLVAVEIATALIDDQSDDEEVDEQPVAQPPSSPGT